MRKPIIAGNWKMYKTPAETVSYLTELKQVPDFLAESERAEVVICAPYLALPALQESVHGTPIKSGAQDVHELKEGAYTGRISAPMLKGYADYVIIGHSEVRRDLNETDARINAKAKALLDLGFIPIIALGELRAERESGSTDQVVTTQTTAALAGLTPAQVGSLVIAYEPIWAIGTGLACDIAEANRVIGLIRALVKSQCGAEAAEAIRIQYGGSVKPENMVGYMQQSEIDGALVGGASLKVDDFVKLVRGALQAKGL
jgi:triosephosphate isomerase